METLHSRPNPTSNVPHMSRLAKVCLTLVAISALALTACASKVPLGISKTEVRLGIVGGSQPLWRYVAQQKEQLLPSSEYVVSFSVYPNEFALKEAFLSNSLDAMATLPTQLPALAQAGTDVQYFLPIAWLKEGYPIIVPSESTIRSPADLDGARLSTFPSDHPGLAYWQIFIQENYGFRVADKASLVISQNPETALLNGEADAATMDSVAWGQLKSQGKFRAVSDLATEWAKISGSSRPLVYGGYVARKDWIERNRRFVDEFIQANFKAFQAFQQDPKGFLDSAASYSEGNASPISIEVLQSVASYLGMSDAAPERAYLTEADAADYGRIFQLLAKGGYLKGNTPQAESLFYISSARPKE